MEPKVVFEDDQILVVEKPAGMVVTDAKTVRGKTVQGWLKKYLKIRSTKHEIRDKFEIKNSNVQNNFGFRISDFGFFDRAGIVHRLDKETSGLLLVAKTPEAFVNLQKQFKQRKIKKKYLALVYGKVAPKEGEIRVPVGRLTGKGIRFGVRPGGKEAATKYHVSCIMYHVSGGKKREHFSLLEVFPLTVLFAYTSKAQEESGVVDRWRKELVEVISQRPDRETFWDYVVQPAWRLQFVLVEQREEIERIFGKRYTQRVEKTIGQAMRKRREKRGRKSPTPEETERVTGYLEEMRARTCLPDLPTMMEIYGVEQKAD